MTRAFLSRRQRALRQRASQEARLRGPLAELWAQRGKLELLPRLFGDATDLMPPVAPALSSAPPLGEPAR